MPRRSAVSSLDAHLGYWLRAVSNHVSHAFQAKVEQHGVTVAEWVILRILFDHDAIRPSEISERIGLTRGTVSKLIDRLADKKLLASRADPGDRRAQIVALTAAGRKLVPALAALADANDREMFDHLTAEQHAGLLVILKDFIAVHGLDAAPID